ncbi:MAG: aldose 1-epimerase family protein [Chloroflexota bacterium]|nr:aldose 1-epimerase family protein [Chloroflexota bacterium]
MWNKETLLKHSADLRQFIDFRSSTLADGQRVIDAHNSSGLTFTLLPDRGMDITSAAYNGLPLTWLAAGSPKPADFAAPWLRLFNGGLLTTCGLTHAGASDTDPVTGEKRDLHGRYTRLRADAIEARTFFDADGILNAELVSSISENSLFGEQLRLKRLYVLSVGSPSVTICDTVENCGDMPTPFMILYHFNLGYPLVRAGARLLSPAHTIAPRDDAARAGLDRHMHYDAPTPGYAEQVFFHTIAPQGGRASVALVNETFGLRLDWTTQHSPYFTQWKNTRQGIYVSGIEPGNCLPEGQESARANGRLVLLQPGETHTFMNMMTVLPDAAAIAAVEAEFAGWG